MFKPETWLLLFIAANLIITCIYLGHVIPRRFDEVIKILIRIADAAGAKLGEKVQSPGEVYPACKWIRISKIELVGGIHHIYVYCSHPSKPMQTYGCQPRCRYLDTSTTGGGALAGTILGGLIGLAIGGAGGVILGCLIGALAGNAIEAARSLQARINELKSKGDIFLLHVDEHLLKP
jgi:hypothetical protein